MGFYKCLRICCAPISQRYVLAIAVLCGLALQFIHRIAFHLVLSEITNTFSVDYSDSMTCNFKMKYTVLVHNKSVIFQGRNHQAEFFWTYNEQTVLISAYYVGNLITLTTGRFLIKIIGLKTIFGLGVFINALGSLLTPLSARYSLYALIAVRTVMGVTQGPSILSGISFSSRWCIYKGGYIFSNMIHSGIVIGGIFGFAGTGLMLQHFKNWESIFYCYAVVSFLWYVFWMVFIYDTVDKHPFISQKEKIKLSFVSALKKTFNEYDITLGTIFKSAPFWAVSFITFGNCWTFYFISNLLPYYLSRVLLFQAHETGLLCSLPFATMFLFTFFFGKMATYLLTKGYTSTKTLTKLFPLLCAIFSPLCMMSASYAACSRILAVAFFSLSLGFFGLEYCAMQVFTKNLSSRNAEMIQVATNSIKALGGISVPVIFAMYNDQTTLQYLSGWRSGFIFFTVIGSVTAVVYLIWGSGEIKNWHYASIILDVPEQSSVTTVNQDVLNSTQNIDSPS